MREQLDAENDERIDSRRPQFEVTASRVKDAGQNQPHAELTLTQTAGRALRQVTVQAAGEYVEGFRSGRADEWGLHAVAGEAVIDGMSPGGSPETLYVHFEYRHVTPIQVSLELSCMSREGDHSWTEHLKVAVDEAIPEPSYISRGRRRGRA